MLFSTSNVTQHCNAMKYIQLCYFAILTLVSNTAGISIFYFLRSIFLENNKVTQITFLNVTRYLQKVIDYVTNYFRAKSN